VEPAGLDYALLVNIAGGLMLATGTIAGFVLILRLARRGRAERPLPVDVMIAARAPAPPPAASPPGPESQNHGQAHVQETHVDEVARARSFRGGPAGE
jgi:hypothetical protein